MKVRRTAPEAYTAAGIYLSPLGPLSLQLEGGCLVGIRSCNGPATGGVRRRGADAALLSRVVHALDAYFLGALDALDALPSAPAPTEFQQRFRNVLLRVRAGCVLSYGALAMRLGTSPRAVGGACARNPLPLVVPCHRVVAHGGSLGGYSLGAGVRHKRWLLRHEGVTF